MSGKTKGVQVKITKINELARYIPYSAHSLNLIGVHFPKDLPEVETFFGTVQKLFNLFSGSTER